MVSGLKKHSSWIWPNLALIQVFTWLMLYGLWVLYIASKWNDLTYGLLGGAISFLCYGIAAYTNFLVLVPRVLRPLGWWAYSALSFVLLLGLVVGRMALEYVVLLPLHGSFYNLDVPHLSLNVITTTLAFLFGALLRLTIDYIQLERRQSELLTRQALIELKLLKAQVHPHFLYNTLNNIYYLVLTKDNKAPEAVAKLSETMRYFTDEAQHDRVSLRTEIQLLTNYIELEQMRMPNSLRIRFDVYATDVDRLVPPMLLMPLVENIYKHGIDKTRPYTEVTISLRQENDRLMFNTTNGLIQPPPTRSPRTGLQNLKERLQLLYGQEFTLDIDVRQDQFHALLIFPL